MSYEIIPTGGLDIKKIKVKINGNIEDRYLALSKSTSNNVSPKTYTWHCSYIGIDEEDIVGYFQNWYSSIRGGSIKLTDMTKYDGYQRYLKFNFRIKGLAKRAIYIKNFENLKNSYVDKELIEDYKNEKDIFILDLDDKENFIDNYKKLNSRILKSFNILKNYREYDNILPEYYSWYDKKLTEEEWYNNRLENIKNKTYRHNYKTKYINLIEEINQDKKSLYTNDFFEKVEKIKKDKILEEDKSMFREIYNDIKSLTLNYSEKLTNEEKIIIDEDLIFNIFKRDIKDYNRYSMKEDIKEYFKLFPLQFKKLLENNKIPDFIKEYNKRSKIFNDKQEEKYYHKKLINDNEEFYNNLNSIIDINLIEIKKIRNTTFEEKYKDMRDLRTINEIYKDYTSEKKHRKKLIEKSSETSDQRYKLEIKNRKLDEKKDYKKILLIKSKIDELNIKNQETKKEIEITEKEIEIIEAKFNKGEKEKIEIVHSFYEMWDLKRYKYKKSSFEYWIEKFTRKIDKNIDLFDLKEIKQFYNNNIYEIPNISEDNEKIIELKEKFLRDYNIDLSDIINKNVGKKITINFERQLLKYINEELVKMGSRTKYKGTGLIGEYQFNNTIKIGVILKKILTSNENIIKNLDKDTLISLSKIFSFDLDKKYFNIKNKENRLIKSNKDLKNNKIKEKIKEEENQNQDLYKDLNSGNFF